MKSYSFLPFMFCLIASSQDTVNVFNYNLLNYDASDTTRNQYYRTILGSLNVDLIVTQENTSLLGVQRFKTGVIDAVYTGAFSSTTFIDGYDTDNMLYYRTSKFTYVSNTVIKTALRDINAYILVHKTYPETLRVYSVHLKASSGSSNELLRAAEVDSLRKVTDALPDGTNFIVCGDFNIYGSTESAYQKLLEVKSGKEGQFYDALSMIGTWNNTIYKAYHTQSPRTRAFGGGATGGLDDRFDMILYSKAVKDTGGIYFIPSSLTPYGNDGNHYNDSINKQPNTAVSVDVANSLHYAADHLPVLAKLVFSTNGLPVEVSYFNAQQRNNSITLVWKTATEHDNYGFEIERRNTNTEWTSIGFVQGAGNSNAPLQYMFTDYPTYSTNNYFFYRLKQIDRSGGYKYLEQIEVNNSTFSKYVLNQNYPNPANPSTTISFVIPIAEHTKLQIVDITGKIIQTLINEQKEAGAYYYLFDGSHFSTGTYFIELEAGSFRQTKKMLFIK